MKQEDEAVTETRYGWRSWLVNPGFWFFFVWVSLIVRYRVLKWIDG